MTIGARAAVPGFLNSASIYTRHAYRAAAKGAVNFRQAVRSSPLSVLLNERKENGNIPLWQTLHC